MARIRPNPLALITLLALLGTCVGCPAQPEGMPVVPKLPEAASPPPQVEPPVVFDDGFQPLRFSDFEAFGGQAGTWTVEGSEIHCSGKPRGYCYTKTAYRNFCLKLDFRFPRPAELADESTYNGNTGVLVYVTGKHKVWPVSLEVQGKYAELGTIKENGGAEPVEIADHEDVRQSARKPVGEWNSLEIVSNEGALTATLNGSLVCQSQPGELKEGAIGLQSEGFEVHFRNVRIEQR